jgi:hypothetical protein
MQNFLKYGFIVLTFFQLISCDNTLDVNDKWTDITVAFSVLDKSQDTQWVRINRAWLGTDDILIGAQSPDSIYYSQVLSVFLDEMDGSTVRKTITLTYDDQSRQLNDGYFTTEGYHLYRTTETINSDYRYRLRIDKGEGSPIVSAETVVLNNSLNITRPSAVAKINLEPFINYGFEYTSQNNSKIFQPVIILNYKEFNINNPSVLSYHQARFLLPTKESINTGGGIGIISGYTTESLLEGWKLQIPTDPNVRRFVTGIDFEVRAGTEDMHTYINVNQPPTGIVTERPDFSNIEGGYGLFASTALNGRYDKELTESGLLQLVLNDISCELQFGRIFLSPSGADTCYCTGNGQCN